MTATLSRIPQSLVEKYEAEAAEARLADRVAAIEERQTILAELDAKIPPLRAGVVNAEAAFIQAEADAKKLVEEAGRKLQAARTAFRNVDYPLSCRRDQLEATLRSDLAHPAIRSALARLDEMFDNVRRTIDAVGHTRAGQLTAWIKDARDTLSVMQLAASNEVDTAVEELMSTQP